MNYFILMAVIFVHSFISAQTNYDVLTNSTQTPESISMFSGMTNTSGISAPPTINDLPSLEIVSSILNSSNTLEDIEAQFENDAPESYNGNFAQPVPEVAQGVWWRFYTQTTHLFNIPAVSEEILSLAASQALWLQDVKTTDTVHSQSQRRLNVAYFDLFNNIFVVFFYKGQDPMSQAVRDKQGFFIRVLSDSSYMQMSTSPKFEPERSMYWRRFPNTEPVLTSPVLDATETAAERRLADENAIAAEANAQQ